MIERATEPGVAWTLYRHARPGASEPRSCRETMDRFVEVVIAAISLNHFGTELPPPLAHAALEGLPGVLRTPSSTRRGQPRRRPSFGSSPILARTLAAALAGDPGPESAAARA